MFVWPKLATCFMSRRFTVKRRFVSVLGLSTVARGRFMSMSVWRNSIRVAEVVNAVFVQQTLPFAASNVLLFLFAYLWVDLPDNCVIAVGKTSPYPRSSIIHNYLQTG